MAVTDFAAGVRGVIFDYGGTLDSRGVHWSHVIYAGWQAAGVPVEGGLFREAYVHAERLLARTPLVEPGFNFRRLMLVKVNAELRYLADMAVAGVNPAEQAPAVADYCYECARLAVEQARPVLEAVSAAMPVALVSNFYGNIHAVLADFGLERYFRAVVESAVAGVRKPDPRIFTLGVEALGLSAHDVLVVGDSMSKDIRPALAAGCRAAWLAGPGWDDDPALWQPPHGGDGPEGVGDGLESGCIMLTSLDELLPVLGIFAPERH